MVVFKKGPGSESFREQIGQGPIGRFGPVVKRLGTGMFFASFGIIRRQTCLPGAAALRHDEPNA